jgi:GDP/UDP-N,N'-diacetylbacillosamine 2-epimerase (hydrolysing)
MRKVCYVTGSRADFGLMASTLLRIKEHPQLEISLCVTGQHLLLEYGNTLADIESLNLPVIAKIPVSLDGSSGAAMARAMAYELLGMVDVFEHNRPDIVLVLGDRGEMLAAALAAMHLNIPIVHLHGGEHSGTIDEQIRHAISKLAHYHFVATPNARKCLIGMGEHHKRIFVTGAPGLDGLTKMKFPSRTEMATRWGFDENKPIVLMVFHPVVQEEAEAGEQVNAILEALQQTGVQVLCLEPNSDAGGASIKKAIAKYIDNPNFSKVEHLHRTDFLAWLGCADILVGNSSSGIIEAASFGLPVINIGSRQQNRERSGNVTDVQPVTNDLITAINLVLDIGRGQWENVYGDGNAGERIVELLAKLPLTTALLSKANVDEQ